MLHRVDERRKICYKFTLTSTMGSGTEPESLTGAVKAGGLARRRGFFDSRYWLRDLILSILLAFVLIFFCYQPVEVRGSSMLPGIESHERIFVNRFVYQIEPIRRGDIIVFRYPLDPAKTFIKRVVGLPGDWVSIRNGRVYINGRRLDEPYVPRAYLDHESYPAVHVPPNHYYVLGDHRDDSNDSRVWGTVNRKLIIGKAVFAYWPLSEAGAVN
jgi:signal peptidase I